MIDIKDVITLDDKNEYVITSKANYDNKLYYYIVDINNNNNTKFCFIDNGILVQIEDQALIVKLLPMMLRATKEEIDKI